MWQLVFANISIKGWVIDSNQHSLSDCSGHALVIPTHIAEIFKGHFMTRVLMMVINGWWWPQVLPESFSKCSAWLPYIFIPHSPPYYTCICKSHHSSLVCYLCLLGGLGAAWWYWPLWNAFQCHVFCRCFFAALTQSLHIGHHYVGFPITVSVVCSFVPPFVIIHGVHPCPI